MCVKCGTHLFISFYWNWVKSVGLLVLARPSCGVGEHWCIMNSNLEFVTFRCLEHLPTNVSRLWGIAVFWWSLQVFDSVVPLTVVFVLFYCLHFVTDTVPSLIDITYLIDLSILHYLYVLLMFHV